MRSVLLNFKSNNKLCLFSTFLQIHNVEAISAPVYTTVFWSKTVKTAAIRTFPTPLMYMKTALIFFDSENV